jgi:hypothetical protein
MAAREPTQAPPVGGKLRDVLGRGGQVIEDRQIHSAITQLRENFLVCRTIGHAWEQTFVGPAGRADEELATRARHHPWRPDGARVLRCRRCRTERVDLCLIGYGRADYHFQLVSRYYRYPDDYKVEGAQGHKDWLHEEIFRRAFQGGDK